MLLIYFLYIIKPIWLNATFIEWRFFFLILSQLHLDFLIDFTNFTIIR